MLDRILNHAIFIGFLFVANLAGLAYTGNSVFVLSFIVMLISGYVIYVKFLILMWIVRTIARSVLASA